MTETETGIEIESDFWASVETAYSDTADIESSEDNSNEKGTRSNPYNFNDEIVIYDYPYSANGASLKYTFTFSEIWKNERVAEEYPNWAIENRIIIRARMDVESDDTDAKTDMSLNFKILTDTLNELGAQIETYESGELNNSIDNVYPGGSYDRIILSQDDGAGLKNTPYITIGYTDQDGNQAEIWISLE